MVAGLRCPCNRQVGGSSPFASSRSEALFRAHVAALRLTFVSILVSRGCSAVAIIGRRDGWEVRVYAASTRHRQAASHKPPGPRQCRKAERERATRGQSTRLRRARSRWKRSCSAVTNLPARLSPSGGCGRRPLDHGHCPLLPDGGLSVGRGTGWGHARSATTGCRHGPG
jgi:hypothetical protein